MKLLLSCLVGEAGTCILDQMAWVCSSIVSTSLIGAIAPHGQGQNLSETLAPPSSDEERWRVATLLAGSSSLILICMKLWTSTNATLDLQAFHGSRSGADSTD